MVERDEPPVANRGHQRTETVHGVPIFSIIWRTFCVLLALVMLLVAAGIAIVSTIYGAIDWRGLFLAAGVVMLGLAALFPRWVDRSIRQRHSLSSNNGITEQQPPISTEEIIEPPLRILLTRRVVQRMLNMAFVFTLLTISAGVLLCVGGMLPFASLSEMGRWLSDLPLMLPLMFMFILHVGIDRYLYSIPVGNPRQLMVPEVIAYYPNTPRDRIRVIFVIIGTSLGVLVWSVAPIAILGVALKILYILTR